MNKTHKFQQNQKRNNMKIDTFYFFRLKPRIGQFLKTPKFLVKKNRTYARQRSAVEDGKWNGMEWNGMEWNSRIFHTLKWKVEWKI